MNSTNYLPKNLKHLRIKRAIKQTDLANLLNCSISTISSWENEKLPKQPSIETLIKLSEFYNISIDLLIKEDLSIRKSTSDLTEGGVYRNIAYFEAPKTNWDSFSKTCLILTILLCIYGFIGRNEGMKYATILLGLVYFIIICVRTYIFFKSNKSIMINSTNEVMFVNELKEHDLNRIRVFYNFVLLMNMLLSSVILVISAVYLIGIFNSILSFIASLLPLLNTLLGVVFLLNSGNYYKHEVDVLDKTRFVYIFFLEVSSMVYVALASYIIICHNVESYNWTRIVYYILVIVSIISIQVLHVICMYVYRKYKMNIKKVIE